MWRGSVPDVEHHLVLRAAGSGRVAQGVLGVPVLAAVDDWLVDLSTILNRCGRDGRVADEPSVLATRKKESV